MQLLDEMTFNDAIELYYEKHQALRAGNMIKLLELKSKCPDIFDKTKDAEIRDMIDYAKDFQKTARYKMLSRQLLREAFTVIRNDSEN